MSSLRARLFAILLLATGLIWLSAVAWIYLGSKREVEQVLDTRLQEAARMVGSLVGRVGNVGAAGAPVAFAPPGGYERQLSCQIWSLDGRMVARSSGAPERRLTDAPAGFSEREVDGETWRVFTVEDAEKGVRVMVGDRLGLRERLVADLIMGLVTPALLVVPLLGMLLWASLGLGLRPLRLMARDLARRDADDMSAIDAGRAPAEVRPLTDALNALFLKVEAARRHEREVTAFAAHELRTPLAGLKTQAQVAMADRDPDVAKAALGQILAGVGSHRDRDRRRRLGDRDRREHAGTGRHRDRHRPRAARLHHARRPGKPAARRPQPARERRAAHADRNGRVGTPAGRRGLLRPGRGTRNPGGGDRLGHDAVLPRPPQERRGQRPGTDHRGGRLTAKRGEAPASQPDRPERAPGGDRVDLIDLR